MTYFLFHFLKLILKILNFWQISSGVSRIFENFWIFFVNFSGNEPLLFAQNIFVLTCATLLTHSQLEQLIFEISIKFQNS